MTHMYQIKHIRLEGARYLRLTYHWGILWRAVPVWLHDDEDA